MVSRLAQEIERGFNLSAVVGERIEMLMAIWKWTRRDGLVLGALEALPDVSYVQERMRRVNALDELGWVDLGANRSPITPVLLTAKGRKLAEEIEHRRITRKERQWAARDAVLYWLDEAGGQQRRQVTLEAMRGPFALFLATSLTAEEIDEAADWLVERDFVRGKSYWGQKVLQPKLTTKGQDVVDSEGSTRGLSSQPGYGEAGGRRSAAITVQGNNYGSVLAGGDHSTNTQYQQVTVSDDHRTQILTLADQVEGQIGDVVSHNPEAGADLADAVADLRAGVTDEFRADRLERGLRTTQRLGNQFAATSGTLGLMANAALGLLQTLGLG